MDTLRPWNPEVGFFHSATKDVQFWSPRRARRHSLSATDRLPMPGRIKRYPRAAKVALPPPATDAAFTNVLLSRRTSRRFSSVPVTLQELSSMLACAAGVQHWARSEDGEMPLKTSPSGGARHPIECYVVVRDVNGLKPAIYHYAADRHRLERIGRQVSIDRMRAYVPESGYFAKASAMVFFTAVFARQLWRYPYSRAYRAALIEAGHVCQTFLLDGNLARPGAVLRHGASRHPGRTGSRHRRNYRIGLVLRGRWPSPTRRYGSPPGAGDAEDPTESERSWALESPAPHPWHPDAELKLRATGVTISEGAALVALRARMAPDRLFAFPLSCVNPSNNASSRKGPP